MADTPGLPEIDWSAFGPTVQTTCFCRCGILFRSHAKAAKVGDRFLLVTQRPCPNCGRRDNCSRAGTDPEEFTIRG
jgi:hypothetical protein